MKYMGSKNRIAKHLLPIILKDRKEGQWYVEPFVGGANMIDKVDGNRVGADSNEYLIAALKLIRDNPMTIPSVITEEDYSKLNKSRDTNGITGFVGFAMSFGGKWFGGYRRDVKGTKGCYDNMVTQTRRSKASAVKQSVNIQGVDLICAKFQELEIPPNSIIYCDPPYSNTTKYKDGDFPHDEFWQWCRGKVKEGHQVFISEYNAPDDFACVWQQELAVTISKGKQKKALEKLFVHKSQLDA